LWLLNLKVEIGVEVDVDVGSESREKSKRWKGEEWNGVLRARVRARVGIITLGQVGFLRCRGVENEKQNLEKPSKSKEVENKRSEKRGRRMEGRRKGGEESRLRLGERASY
jgi:hypothetical protein